MKRAGTIHVAGTVAMLIAISITAFASAAETTDSETPGEQEDTLFESKTADDSSSGGELSEDFLSYGSEEMPKQSLLGVLLRLVLSMVAIVALIYGTVYVLKYFAKKGADKPAEDRLVQVVEKVNLDARRSVYLVKVIDRIMILGVGGDNVNILGEINDESVVESVKSTDFSFHLGNIFSRMHAR